MQLNEGLYLGGLVCDLIGGIFIGAEFIGLKRLQKWFEFLRDVALGIFKLWFLLGFIFLTLESLGLFDLLALLVLVPISTSQLLGGFQNPVINPNPTIRRETWLFNAWWFIFPSSVQDFFSLPLLQMFVVAYVWGPLTITICLGVLSGIFYILYLTLDSVYGENLAEQKFILGKLGIYLLVIGFALFSTHFFLS